MEVVENNNGMTLRRRQIVKHEATKCLTEEFVFTRKDPFNKLYVGQSRVSEGEMGAFLRQSVKANEPLGVFLWDKIEESEQFDGRDRKYMMRQVGKVKGIIREVISDGVKGDTASSYINDPLDWAMPNVRLVVEEVQIKIVTVVYSMEDIDEDCERSSRLQRTTG